MAGAFGKVKLVRVKATGKEYALKEIDKRSIKKSGMEKQVANEIKIMYSLDHENIVKLYNHYEDENNCALLMEFAPKVP
jgi:serine/threonine protein kinase